METQGSDRQLLAFGFNQDSSCFACSSNSGFQVFSCEPYKPLFRRDFRDGGIGVVELLFRCNIVALVGGGSTPRFPPNNVIIWDDEEAKRIAELSFRSEVKSVRLRRDRIVACQENKISVYNFADLKVLHTINTGPNPRGLVSLSSHPDFTVLACPGLQAGKVRIDLYDRHATKFICAHDSPLAALEMSLDGRILATASERGTLIRVWNTSTGYLLQELRRGLDAATIFSISISKSCDYLAVSSDKGTVHIFALRCFTPLLASENEQRSESPKQGLNLGQNQSSVFASINKIVPLSNYFNSEWSLAQFRLPEDCWSVVAFADTCSSTFFILNQKGSFYRVEFDPLKGGPCTQKSYRNILEGD